MASASKDRPAGGKNKKAAAPLLAEGGEERDGGPVCAVLAGAGARGAYEAGMLAELLPELEECGARPTMFIGTSAGAINAVLFASVAHLSAKQAADEVLRVWRSITKDQVFKAALSLDTVGRVLTSVGMSGLSLTGLLDTSPLLKTLNQCLDWDQLHKNTAPDGMVEAVAVAATSCDSGRTEVFAEGPRVNKLPAYDNDRALDYISTNLSADHVRASAAIPVLFPPAQIPGRLGWYMDGGVRLNAPLKPAIALSAGRIVMVATTPATYVPPVSPAVAPPRPTMQGLFAQVLNSVLGDYMIEDLNTLSNMNQLVSDVRSATKRSPTSPGPNARAYEIIKYLFGGPGPAAGGDQLSDIATNVLTTDFPGGRRWWGHRDLAALTFLLGPGQDSDDLLSYIFFEPQFIDAAIRKGQEDAQIILDAARRLKGEPCSNLFQT
jgi:NTE family protein